MKKVISWNLDENFIDKLADFIIDNFKVKANDFSRVACVFGGKRPALFLRRVLSQKINKPFYPPTVFTIEQFIEYILSDSVVKPIAELEAAYRIYQITEKHSPQLLKKRESFSEFLPWAREINSFIEQLDLEDIANSQLEDIAKSAEIGYDVPARINLLLSRIAEIRKAYHKLLASNSLYSRGRMYLEASRQIKKKSLDEFDAVIFGNFFYLHRTELEIFKEIKAKGKGLYIFKGSSKAWPVLDKNATELAASIEPDSESKGKPNLKFYQGFDTHSQVALANQVFKKINNKENSLIVLPKPQTLIPLLTEMSSSLGKCNVSMGYPITYSSVYALFSALRKAQESKKDKRVYTKDYLNLIRHPLVKNLKINQPPQVTRVIVHKLEELLQGVSPSSIGGSLFLTLAEIESEEKIYSLASQTLQAIDIDIEEKQCRKVLQCLHELLFSIWPAKSSFLTFAENFQKVLQFLVENSSLGKFPLNLKVVEKIQALTDEFKQVSFKDQSFNQSEIWDILQQRLDFEKISFIGSPLSGSQILGLFETRSLSFENVIVVDANEGVLPSLKIYEPLIPREVMLSLGLRRLEKEEEIQRYLFNSLIASAKNVHLIYEKNQEKERSRFLEDIFWKIQQAKAKFEAVKVSGVSFAFSADSSQKSITKTAEVIDFMKQEKYSASRLNTYLSCKLRFYYQYVLGLKEQEDALDEPQASHIGTFIHELLEETFKKFQGRTPLIDRKFRDYFFAEMDKKFSRELIPRMKSDSFLLARIIKNRLERFLDNEAERKVKKLICLEDKRSQRLNLGKYSLEFNYTVDRIDELVDDSIVIIDYKTGGSNFGPKKLKFLETMEMNRESIKENIKSFQLPLYYCFTAQAFPGRNLNAELYNLRNLERKSFIAESDYQQREKVLALCLKALEAIFDELFDPDVPFSPEPEERKCSFCPFQVFCL